MLVIKSHHGAFAGKRRDWENLEEGLEVYKGG